jgi:hypothetical protein
MVKLRYYVINDHRIDKLDKKGMEIMLEYTYTNDLGYHKKIVVESVKDGKFHCQIWSMDTGDFCGCGDKTADELREFLHHYGITI